MQVWPLGGLRRGGGAHSADDLTGGDSITFRHSGLGLKAGIGGLVTVPVVQHHGGTHQGILGDGNHLASAGGQHLGTGVGGGIILDGKLFTGGGFGVGTVAAILDLAFLVYMLFRKNKYSEYGQGVASVQAAAAANR